MISLLAIISIAVYSYFPARLHRQIVDAVELNAVATTEMAAFSVAEGLQARNEASVAAALAGLRMNPDLAYFVLLDEQGHEFASFNELVARETAFQSIRMRPVNVRQRALQAGRVLRSQSRDTVGGRNADDSIYQTMTVVRHRGKPIGRLYGGMSLARANADAARGRTRIALITLVAFVLLTAAAFAFSSLITRPLERIVETTEDIAAGDLSKRAAVTGEDEVGLLARSFNRMVEQLEEWNRSLESRVDARTRQLAKSEERYRLLFERNLAGVYVASEDGKVLDCNDACARLFGYATREEFLAQGAIDYMHRNHRDSIVRRLREQGAVTNEEVELRGRDGKSVWVLENVRRIVAEEGETALLEGILLDISERKRAEEEIAFKAYHDSLTGLPNRGLFLDRLEIALAHARRNGSSVAVLFLDLDNVKSINDTFGHTTGDRVLQVIGDRLVGVVRAGDTVARVGGDEFVVLLTVGDAPEIESVARKILARVTEPISVGDDEIFVTTSIGVAIYPGDGEDAVSLIRNADGAMYRVKEGGGNDVQLSSRTGSRRTVGRMSLEEQLRAAIDRDEFVLHYQPQVHIESRLLSGAEALVRWQRPDGTLVSPAGFMTVCEQSGLITPLGELVLYKAAQQMVEWQSVGTAPPRCGVNVSARQFYQRDFTGMVERVLGETGLAPMRLELEITETVAMQTSERSLHVLQHFREMGIAVAVDDFGTGQSSLSYLKRFPVDTVKIDRSFVRDLIVGDSDEWIVTAVLMLANHLGLRTVAEGVETEEQAVFLKGHDCREIQGYLISKPLSAADFAEQWLTRKERRTRATV
jgi:diguanylate cyclase (GGDEF)-like protein/PAS domain S-box-containing protein